MNHTYVYTFIYSYLLHSTQVGFVCLEGNKTRRILGGGTTTPFTHFFLEIPREKLEMYTTFWLFILRPIQPPHWSKGFPPG